MSQQQNSQQTQNIHDRPLSTTYLIFDAIWNATRFVLLVTFLSLYSSEPCDTPIKTYLIALLFLNVIYLVPQTPLVYWTDRFPTYKYHPVVNAVRRFWNFCTVVDWGVHVAGNVWTFKSKTCRYTNPHIYWLSITEIIIFYLFVVLVPATIIILFICCYSRIRRRAGVNGGIEFPGGLTPLELSRLPTFSFHENEDGKSGGEEGRVEEVRVDVVKLEIPGDDQDPNPQPQSESQSQPQNSSSQTCSICFCDYEPGDRLRQLACSHRFHKECVDTWLAPTAHRTCPLCVKEAVRPEDRDPKYLKAKKRKERDELAERPALEAAIEASRRGVRVDDDDDDNDDDTSGDVGGSGVGDLEMGVVDGANVADANIDADGNVGLGDLEMGVVKRISVAGVDAEVGDLEMGISEHTTPENMVDLAPTPTPPSPLSSHSLDTTPSPLSPPQKEQTN